jgi:hypothetical protein
VIVGDLEDADLWIERAGAAAAGDRPRDREASLPGGDAACEFLAAPIAQHMALELEMEVEAAGAGCCGCRFETQITSSGRAGLRSGARVQSSSEGDDRACGRCRVLTNVSAFETPLTLLRSVRYLKIA